MLKYVTEVEREIQIEFKTANLVSMTESMFRESTELKMRENQQISGTATLFKPPRIVTRESVCRIFE